MQILNSRWYEELKHQYEQEKIKMKENISQLNFQLDEMREKIGNLNKEKADLEVKIKGAEKQIK